MIRPIFVKQANIFIQRLGKGMGSNLHLYSEEVYRRHRIWPKERSDSKPSLDAVMSQAQLEKKVADCLRNSQALGMRRWGQIGFAPFSRTVRKG